MSAVERSEMEIASAITASDAHSRLD